jgi:hypothetical protein
MNKELAMELAVDITLTIMLLESAVPNGSPSKDTMVTMLKVSVGRLLQAGLVSAEELLNALTDEYSKSLGNNMGGFSVN